jgi:hypothetical protein
MKAFDYERAPDAQAAVALVAGRPGAVFLGGGTNLVDHMKLGIVSPEMLVDVTRLPFGAVEERDDGGCASAPRYGLLAAFGTAPACRIEVPGAVGCPLPRCGVTARSAGRHVLGMPLP